VGVSAGGIEWGLTPLVGASAGGFEWGLTPDGRPGDGKGWGTAPVDAHAEASSAEPTTTSVPCLNMTLLVIGSADAGFGRDQLPAGLDYRPDRR